MAQRPAFLSWPTRAALLTGFLGLVYFGVVACSARPSSWPNQTSTPLMNGVITPVSQFDPPFNGGAICGTPAPGPGSCSLVYSGCGGGPALFPSAPIGGRCINYPFDRCAGGPAPHFCWWTMPQAAEYTIVVEDMSPTPKVIWAWTFRYANATPTVVGVEYGNTAGTPNPSAIPLGGGGPYATPTQVGPTPGVSTPTRVPRFRWGVIGRIDNQYFALGGPWEFETPL